MSTPQPQVPGVPPPGAELPLDYRIAFDLAPIGLVQSRQRQIVDCNQQLLAMFGAQRDSTRPMGARSNAMR